MHFLKLTAAVAVLSTSGVVALPPWFPGGVPPLDIPNIPLPGSANNLLRTITNDVAILDRATDKGSKEIRIVLESAKSSTDAAFLDKCNEKINSHFEYMQEAALNAGYGVEGDVADSAQEIDVQQAKALKGDAQYLAHIAMEIADTFKYTASQKVSDANGDLASHKAAMISSLESLAHPLMRYISITEPVDAGDSVAAVADMKATCAGLVTQMRSYFA